MPEGATSSDLQRGAVGTSWRRDEEPVFSTRLFAPMLDFFRERYGEEALVELLADFDETPERMADTSRWVSANLGRRLGHAMVQRTGDPRLTYKAGLAVVDPRRLGPTFWALRAMGSPDLVYARVGQMGASLSRITRFTVESFTRGRAVIRFHVAEGHVDDPLFCLNRQGVLAGIPRLFGLPTARVEHPHCLHEGAETCEYVVSWKPLDRGARRWFLASLLAAGGVGLAAGLGALPALAWAGVPLFPLLGAGAILAQHLRYQRETIDASMEVMAALEARADESRQRYRDLLTLRRIDRLTRAQVHEDELLDTVLAELTTTLGYDRAALLGRAERGFPVQRQLGYRTELDALRELRLPDGSPLLASLAARPEGVLVDAVEPAAGLPVPAAYGLLEVLGARAAVAVPLEGKGGPLGLLLADRQRGGGVLGRRDLELLSRLATLLVLAIENARMVERLEAQREELRNALLLNQKYSLYLPGPVVERLGADPAAGLSLGGTPVRAAVLFCDIVGFTPWAEGRSPVAVMAALNRFFASMDAAIERHRGVLDKRMGDCVMVVFPERDDEAPPAARRALACGLDMQRAVGELGASEPEDGLRGLRVRVGVAWGELVAGNVGSHRRLEYTVIGDTVNVASRLCSACRPGGVLAMRSALERAGPGIEAEPVGEVAVKGRAEAVDAVELRAVAEWT